MTPVTSELKLQRAIYITIDNRYQTQTAIHDEQGGADSKINAENNFSALIKINQQISYSQDTSANARKYYQTIRMLKNIIGTDSTFKTVNRAIQVQNSKACFNVIFF